MPAERNVELFPVSCIRIERISHIRAVMTILWDRLAYAGSVSTLNPEIQKRKQKSHQEFNLSKILGFSRFFPRAPNYMRKKMAHSVYIHTVSTAAIAERLQEAQSSGHHTNIRNIGDRFPYQRSTPKPSAMQAAGISGTSQLLTHFH